MDHQHDTNRPLTLKEQVNFLVGVAQIVASPLELVLRRPGTAGECYFNGRTFIGILLMFVFIVFAEGPHPGNAQAVWAGGIAFVLLVAHKSRERLRDARGDVVHSRYVGRSWLPGDETWVKSNLEPVVALFAGLFCLAVAKGLALYLIVSSCGLAISVSFAQLEHRARVRGLRDAMIEQGNIMDQLRDLNE